MKIGMMSTAAIVAAIGVGLAGFAVMAQSQEGDAPFVKERQSPTGLFPGAQADGPLSREELQARLEADFSAIDTDADGGISQDEMTAHRKAVREARRAERQARRFARQDANGDGVIGPDEFQPRRMARFARMDIDDDGIISEEERLRHSERRARRGHRRGDRRGHRRGYRHH